jgi:hypothetical protein
VAQTEPRGFDYYNQYAKLLLCLIRTCDDCVTIIQNVGGLKEYS